MWPRHSNVETRFGADVPIEMCGIETDRAAVDTVVREVPSVARGPRVEHLANFIHSGHTGMEHEVDGNRSAEQGAIVWSRYPGVSGIPEVGVQGLVLPTSKEMRVIAPWPRTRLSGPRLHACSVEGAIPPRRPRI